MGYLFGGLLDGSGGLAQSAVHVLGADLERVGHCALNQVLLVIKHKYHGLTIDTVKAEPKLVSGAWNQYQHIILLLLQQ